MTFSSRLAHVLSIAVACLLILSPARTQITPQLAMRISNLSTCEIWKKGAFIRQGFSFRAKLQANCTIGYAGHGDCFDIADSNDTLGPLQYPAGSENEYFIFPSAGPWLGAKLPDGTPVVTTANATGSVEFYGFYSVVETKAETSRGDAIWTTSANTMFEPNKRGFDDDGDGRIDEDELDGTDNDGDWLAIRDDLNLNGKPDHGEPNVDEDYGAVSDYDVYISCRDSFAKPTMPLHTPLGLRILQKSYAWKDAVKEPILFMEYSFIHSGLTSLDSVFIGFFASLQAWSLHNPDVPPHYNEYLEDVRTIVCYNSVDTSVAVVGVTLLGSSLPFSSLKLTCLRYIPIDGYRNYRNSDAERYADMASGIVDVPGIARRDSPVLLSVGPFPTMHPGDTLKLAVAIVLGEYVRIRQNNVHDNAAKAIDLYRRNYLPPAVPPSPPLRLTSVGNAVRLDFDWRPGDPRFDPLETWDDSNKVVSVLPDTHWRRRNPPPGKSAGGRVFEAFRIYRSDYPVFQENTFNLLHQFDVDDDLDFEGQTGISFSFIDSSLKSGKSYWYTVTSLSVPDHVYLSYTTTMGTQAIDTVLTAPIESKLFDNVERFSAPFAVSTRAGEVKVVPNPYRTNQSYAYESGGAEGLARLWTELQRTVIFIHLPARCTIRIYSLVGESIRVIEHDDAQRLARGLPEGTEEFPLFSDSNRTLASGIYIYLVESEYGTQTGKFVIIR